MKRRLTNSRWRSDFHPPDARPDWRRQFPSWCWETITSSPDLLQHYRLVSLLHLRLLFFCRPLVLLDLLKRLLGPVEILLPKWNEWVLGTRHVSALGRLLIVSPKRFYKGPYVVLSDRWILTTSLDWVFGKLSSERRSLPHQSAQGKYGLKRIYLSWGIFSTSSCQWQSGAWSAIFRGGEEVVCLRTNF